MKNILIVLCFILLVTNVFAQKDGKQERVLSDPITADSGSTLIIPILYNSELLSTNKMALMNNYYANILFYDYKTDTSKRLFKDDVFITALIENYYYRPEAVRKPNTMSSKWIFYFVKDKDYNKSGRVDGDDPAILYVSDKQGNNLKAITTSDAHAESIEIFEKQGFALIKMQRDSNQDNDFSPKDQDFYYVRLDLNTLEFGNKIEIK